MAARHSSTEPNMPMMLAGIVVICILIAVNLAVWIGGIYVVLHFASKWW